ncbi:hypothetical protein ABK040_010410 [Willaertia magna]
MFKTSIIFNILVICVVTLVINSFYGVNASVIDWSTLTADQLNNVTLEEFTFVTAENISVIPSSACSGFKAQQIASISDLACSGFKSDCFKNIPPTSYSGFKPNCVSNWTVTEMNGIVSEFMISNLAAEVFTVMTKNHTVNLVASACRGIDVQKISLIQSTGCGGFSKECVSNIPVDAFKGITGTNCFFTPSGISGLSKYQIANIVRTNFEKWTKEMIAALEGEVCQGITSSQMNDLREYSPNNVCIGFTSSCIMNIPVDSFTAVNPGCINNLNLTAISAAQLKVLPSVSFPWLYDSTIRKLNGDVCSGLTSAQIGQLTTQCVGFSKECVIYIPSTSFTGISDSCFFTTDAIYGLNKDQLNNIPRNNFAKWTKEMIASIPADACKGITSSQMNDLREYSPNNVCIGFTGSCIANIPVDSFTAVNPGCINNLNLTAVSAAQLKVLPSVSFPWLYDSTIRKLNGDVCSGITKDQIAQLTTQCSAFTKDCLSYIPKESLPGLTDTCVFSTSAIPGLNKDQINSISRTIFAKWTKSMMAAISSDACQGITIHQMNDLYGAAGDACAGFTPSCIANIPTNSFSALNPGFIPYNSLQYVTQGTLQKLRGSTCSGITGNQLGILTTQCADFTSDCLSYIPNDSFRSIASTSTCFFSINAIPGLRKEQITNINRANFAKWNKNMMAAISGETCQGITIHQMNDLYGTAGDACAGFTPSCIANIPTNSFSALNPGCINNINMTAVSSNQFTVIPYVAFPYVYSETVAKLRGNICSGFTRDQLASMSSQCVNLNADCINYVATPSLERMSPNCLKVITQQNILGFTKDQLVSLTSFTLGGITANQLVTLYNNPAYSISNLLNATQIETVDSNVILTFKKRFESGLLTPNRIILSDEIGSTLTWLQLAVSTKSSVSQIMNSNSIITVAFNKTFQGLRSDHIQALENEIFKNTNINQLDNLLIDIFSTINAEQLSNIPLVGFSTKDKALYKTFNGVNPTAIPGINQPQLSAIIVNIPSTLWTCEQFRNLTEQQVQWFKVESVDTFNTISQRCSQPEPQPSPIPSVSPKPSLSNPVPKPSNVKPSPKPSSFTPQPTTSLKPGSSPKPSLSNPVPKPSSFKPQPTASLKPGSSPKPSTKPQPTTSLKPHVSTSKIGSPKPSAKPAMSSKAISNPPRGNPRVSEGSNLAVYSLWMLIISLLISLLL